MKYSIFNKLRVRKEDEMSIKPKRVEGLVQREKQPSIEHRTEIQLQLQELRNLLLESGTVEATRATGLSDGQQIVAFQTELEESVHLADMR
jgi:hypothetical protein